MHISFSFSSSLQLQHYSLTNIRIRAIYTGWVRKTSPKCWGSQKKSFAVENGLSDIFSHKWCLLTTISFWQRFSDSPCINNQYSTAQITYYLRHGLHVSFVYLNPTWKKSRGSVKLYPVRGLNSLRGQYSEYAHYKKHVIHNPLPIQHVFPRPLPILCPVYTIYTQTYPLILVMPCWLLYVLLRSVHSAFSMSTFSPRQKFVKIERNYLNATENYQVKWQRAELNVNTLLPLLMPVLYLL